MNAHADRTRERQIADRCSGCADLKLAEQKQAALLRRVAEINEELTHFAYGVSHDLCTD